MKGILTFTLAAGVAITSTTIAHAAGTKPVANPTKAPVTTPSSSPFSGLELALDRASLTRELSRLNELLNLQEIGEDTSTGDVPLTTKSAGAWTF